MIGRVTVRAAGRRRRPGRAAGLWPAAGRRARRRAVASRACTTPDRGPARPVTQRADADQQAVDGARVPGELGAQFHPPSRIVDVRGQLPGDPVAGGAGELRRGVPAGAGQHRREPHRDAEPQRQLVDGEHVQPECARVAEALERFRVHDARRARAVADRPADRVHDDLGQRALMVETADAEERCRGRAVAGQGGAFGGVTVGVHVDPWDAVVGVELDESEHLRRSPGFERSSPGGTDRAGPAVHSSRCV